MLGPSVCKGAGGRPAPLRMLASLREVPCAARSRGPVAELAARAALAPLKQPPRVRVEARCARGPRALRCSAAHEALRRPPARAFARRGTELSKEQNLVALPRYMHRVPPAATLARHVSLNSSPVRGAFAACSSSDCR